MDNAIEAWRANFLWALGVNVPIAVVSYALRAVRTSGLVLGLIYGVVIYSCGGPRVFLVLFSFFLVGSIASKACAKLRMDAEPAIDKQGRGAGSVAGKCTVGVFLAVLISMSGGPVSQAGRHEIDGMTLWLALAYAGAFAAALADTCASELGPLHGKKAILLWTVEPVPHGTPGAVSTTGTIFGVMGAIMVGLLAVMLGLVREKAIIYLMLSSFIASGMESFLRSRWPDENFLAKQSPNIVVTLTGALGAVVLALALGY